VAGTPEATRRTADLYARVLGEATFVERVVALGWTDRARLAAIGAACRAWGAHPDAFTAHVICDTIGRAA